MKILIINQPLNNRGDESAHKALVRRLVKAYPDSEINVLFDKSANPDSIRQFLIDEKNVNYIHFVPKINKGFKKISEFGLRYDMHVLWLMHPAIRKWLQYFKKSDIIICAPGGIDMGGFQSWFHLFNLYCAKFYNKPIAYYGRSIGPFPTETSKKRKFKKLSIEILHYCKYISLRDNKSEQEAQKIGVNSISVVDTAFLDSPMTIIPEEIVRNIGKSPYFVFVPNLLIWHYLYKGKATKADSITFYTKVLKSLFNKYPGYIAVMLPQTFNYASYLSNDVSFMREIAQNFNSDEVKVIDDIYSSDIQQAIISKSSFIVGARYHSVVFAINNSIPFIALSYEHKIEGLLETLGMKDSMIDIMKVFDSKDIQNSIITKIEEKLPLKKFDKKKTLLAKEIAENGFYMLIRQI